MSTGSAQLAIEKSAKPQSALDPNGIVTPSAFLFAQWRPMSRHSLFAATSPLGSSPPD